MLNFSQKIDNSLVRKVILVLAILVIFESVWVVQRIIKIEQPSFVKVSWEPTPVPSKPAEIEVWAEGDESLNIGQTGRVTIGITGLKTTQIMAIDLILRYDPTLLRVIDQNASVSGIQIKTEETVLGQVARNLVEEGKGRIILSLVNLNKNGALLKEGEKIILGQITILPKVEGSSELSFKLTTPEEPGTKVAKLAGKENLAVIKTKNYRVLVSKTTQKSED